MIKSAHTDSVDATNASPRLGGTRACSGAGEARADELEEPGDEGRTGLEEHLVRLALEGDGRAFATLVRPHLSTLYRIGRRVTGDDALAEDVVQETLTIAFRKLGRYRPGTSLRAHLAAIAVKRGHTLLRAEMRRKRHEEAAPPPASMDRADELIEAAVTESLLRAALSSMPRKRREAVLLRLDAGLSFAEIAATLRTSEGSARVLVHLALKGLREQLGTAD